MKYRVSTESRDILKNETIRPNKYGGWMAVNTGTADATVDGYPLSPGDGLDLTHLSPDVIWDTPIQIVLSPGAKVRITRFLYTEVKK